MTLVLVTILIQCSVALETTAMSDEEPLESLLAGQIQRASCEARCQPADNAEDRDRCLEVCLMGEVPREICQYAWLCGRGCSLACSLPVHQPEVRLEDLLQHGCQVAWNREEEKLLGSVVYIVAGEDGAGMGNVVAPLLHHTSLQLSSNQMERYEALVVMAVTAAGVVDKRRLPLMAAQCEPTLSPPSLQLSEPLVSLPEPKSTYWLVAASLILILLLVLSAVVCCIGAARCRPVATRSNTHMDLKTAEVEENFRPIVKPGAKYNRDLFVCPVSLV